MCGLGPQCPRSESLSSEPYAAKPRCILGGHGTGPPDRGQGRSRSRASPIGAPSRRWRTRAGGAQGTPARQARTHTVGGRQGAPRAARRASLPALWSEPGPHASPRPSRLLLWILEPAKEQWWLGSGGGRVNSRGPEALQGSQAAPGDAVIDVTAHLSKRTERATQAGPLT